ncbi:protein of unknown function [Paenibacillus alvei]|uniref:Holin-like toxin n=1 Tax=Paenibacillus alvei TaxID=44250 RepID=A0A383RLC1_PAEAL|nr:protein of unknown function [Paenibacillus alvei]
MIMFVTFIVALLTYIDRKKK